MGEGWAGKFIVREFIVCKSPKPNNKHTNNWSPNPECSTNRKDTPSNFQPQLKFIEYNNKLKPSTSKFEESRRQTGKMYRQYVADCGGCILRKISYLIPGLPKAHS